ncbi:UDP-N-acetylmuramoyl-L-alanyl-D-glutamate--2,6-diaminopimelate ligase [Aliidiomarina soli]|uniref:UDP-N-acetylmuramoyl-L-alanyl-D-glutamate--2,6-diaminopimelate ligase n=1 Tax=Aliidiomarina soli TaxID=1928574 RepID=A0A432WJX5_9GAMM|nr:UDP-N-acetylmuramoyl-L-alanyl-D-glutamate--2,6-diaminopimelate ligase [Aliidiomarina soli]
MTSHQLLYAQQGLGGNVIKLIQLLPDAPETLPDIEVSGLKLDSRQVTHGDCFVAVPGYQVDGRHFINAALQAGARAVLQQADNFSIEQRDAVAIISVPHLNEQLSAIGGRFYNQPSERLKLIGVTGTNGKTTVTHLVAQLYQGLAEKAAVLGTLGSGFIDALLAEKNTTPDALTVQSRLAGLANEGADVVAMEVSSHALVQGRVNDLRFAAVVATNVSRDHLDYHGSMESYAAAKQDLFDHYPARARIYNLDDPIVCGWYQQSARPAYGYSLEAPADGYNGEGVLRATGLEFDHEGAQFTLHWQGQQVAARLSLLGEFNVSNALAALLVLLSEGYTLLDVVPLLSTLQPVAGRMETFSAPQRALAIVDYAHTPDALEQVLKAARRHCKGQLWCVFGCGGDRDRGKRPQMGNVASQHADIVVVTDDNPRTESAEAIIADVVSGVTGSAQIIQHPGREAAVRYSLQHAQPDDVVVMAGKGHEDYQIVGTQTLDYNERAVVAACMNEVAL